MDTLNNPVKPNNSKKTATGQPASEINPHPALDLVPTTHKGKTSDTKFSKKNADKEMQNEMVQRILERARKMKGKDPCWPGYQMVGQKTKNGRKVPNCVPKESFIDLSEEALPYDKNAKIGFWKDQGDREGYYTLYHGTHEDNVESMMKHGLNKPDPTTGMISTTPDPDTAHGYAAMSGTGGETQFRKLHNKAVNTPHEERAVIKMRIPKEWADKHIDPELRGNLGNTRDRMLNKSHYEDWKKANPEKSDSEYYTGSEVRFSKPIPPEFNVGYMKRFPNGLNKPAKPARRRGFREESYVDLSEVAGAGPLEMDQLVRLFMGRRNNEDIGRGMDNPSYTKVFSDAMQHYVKLLQDAKNKGKPWEQVAKDAVASFPEITPYGLFTGLKEILGIGDAAIKNRIVDEESDNEYEMARNQLSTAKRAIDALMKRMRGNGDLPAWVQAKITKGSSALDDVSDYMQSNKEATKEEVELDEINSGNRKLVGTLKTYGFDANKVEVDARKQLAKIKADREEHERSKAAADAVENQWKAKFAEPMFKESRENVAMPYASGFISEDDHAPIHTVLNHGQMKTLSTHPDYNEFIRHHLPWNDNLVAKMIADDTYSIKNLHPSRKMHTMHVRISKRGKYHGHAVTKKTGSEIKVVKSGGKSLDQMNEHIVKMGNKWRLVSKKTGKNLGTYDSREGAEKRERQVQYFKNIAEQRVITPRATKLTDKGMKDTPRPYSYTPKPATNDARNVSVLTPRPGRNNEEALGKVHRTSGGPKKFMVKVKDPSTHNVKTVRFGDPNMEIKRDDPKRRASFRARHHCDTNPGPRTKARYWSCRQWRSGSKVEG